MSEISDKLPVYERIKQTIKERILRGDLREGDRVPSEYELVREMGVSRNQTRQALRELEVEGLIVRRQGAGSFVAPSSLKAPAMRPETARTVAIAFPEYNTHYSRGVIEGFMSRMSEEGFHVVSYYGRYDGDSEFEFLTTVPDTGVIGFAIWLLHDTDQVRDLLTRLRERSYPVVLIDRRLRGLDVDFTATDNREVFKALTAALIARGHERIGFLSADVDRASSVEDREEGYRLAMTEAGLPCGPQLMTFMSATPRTVEAAVERLMAPRFPPTALLCLNDSFLPKIVEVLNHLGYDIPGDIELATMDDSSFAEEPCCPLVYVRQPALEIGRQGAELLLARLRNPEEPIRQVLLEASPPALAGYKDI